jgi:hypothetical protein
MHYLLFFEVIFFAFFFGKRRMSVHGEHARTWHCYYPNSHLYVGKAGVVGRAGAQTRR